MYDYIIVGGGTAGCALANRLSANPAIRVLLLEAGDRDTRPEIRIPAAFSKLFRTEADWAYETVPQPGLSNRQLYWPRGKVLGGSSAINAMIYIRGHQADYDGWAAQGCHGWGYADVLPYFKRSEDNARGADPYHGVGGPLRIEDPRDPSLLSRLFIEGAARVGIGETPDFNGATQEGAGLYQLNQRGGRRQSAAAAFIRPVLGRENLTVETNSFVTRIRFDGLRASGVQVLQDGLERRIDTDGEVILCGGSINSPQLLMLSGIGPADHLREKGIQVLADRPEVGQNLQDHLIVGLRYRTRTVPTLLAAESMSSIARYVLFRRGMLTSNIAEAGAFVTTRPGPTPDLQFHVAPVLFEAHGAKPPTEDGFSLGPTLVRTATRGQITLHSASPYEHPAINPNYLDDPGDVATLVEGLKMAREIAEGSTYDAVRGEQLAPAPGLRSDAELAQYVRDSAETLYHPVGTCRMGADKNAVVDLALRVNGVEGLRVVDASIMPSIVNGNTNAPTLMIAEKAADLILQAIPTPQTVAVA